MAGWWRRRSLRSRLTLLTVAGLAVGLAVGGSVLVAALGLTLQRSVDAEATQAGQDVARLVAEGALPDPVPVAGEQQVQVVDARSRVLAASIGADRLVPILRDPELAELRAGGKRYVDGDRIGVRGRVRVVAVPVGAGAGAADAPVVIVAKPMADLRHSVDVVRTVLLVAFPLLVAGLAAVTWRVVGATLRPVEALRAGAAEIAGSGPDPAAGLPVPASEDEVHRLAVTLNDMLDRLERARARQRGFVADAAHELRSPLANLRTELEVAQRLGDRQDWPELAGELLADVRRLGRLVDDLLLLARADEAGPARPGVVEPVELGELLRAVAERYPPVAVADTPEPHWTRGEPDALRRVVANLVENAVRHTRTGVRLAVTADGAEHLVTVTDDGPGIPAADRERVFARFARLDDARARDAGGAGLGLAIARELVRRHGGTVRLADAGPGVRAEVRLPDDQGQGRQRGS